MGALDQLRGIWSDGSGLGPQDRAVLTVLVLRSGDDGRCWPSLTRIARDAGVGRSSAARSLNRIEAAGWIRRSRRPLPHSTLYQIVPQRDYPGAGPSHSGTEIVPQRDTNCP